MSAKSYPSALAARVLPLGTPRTHHQLRRQFGYSNMSLNVPRPFPKMGTLLDLQNGYIHLKDPKRVHCCTSGKQAQNGYITRLLGKNVNNVIF